MPGGRDQPADRASVAVWTEEPGRTEGGSAARRPACAVDGDEVVAAPAGAKVIVEPAAAEYLDDKVLDVRQDDEGNPAFAIALQEQDS